LKKGVDAAGAAGFEDRANAVGPQRFAQGIGRRRQWVANTTPYLNMMAGLSLDTPLARRIPQNQQRSAESPTATVVKKSAIAEEATNEGSKKEPPPYRSPSS